MTFIQSCSVKRACTNKEDFGMFIVLLFLFVPRVVAFYAPVLNKLGAAQLTSVLTGLFVVYGIFKARKHIRSSVNTKDIATFLFCNILLLFSIVFYPNSEEFVTENYLTFSTTVFAALFIGLSIDPLRHSSILMIIARLGVIAQVLWQFLSISGIRSSYQAASDGSAGEQMTEAFSLVFPVIYLLIVYGEKKYWQDLVLFVIGFFLLLFMGTRGPVLVTSFFILGYYWFFRSNSMKYKVLLAIVTGVLWTFIDTIMLTLIYMASNLGFSTRVFEKTLNDSMVNINESSGRDDLFTSIINDIKDNNWGYGWGYDHFHYFDYSKGQLYDYAHNLELELLVQFGVFAGSLIILWIFYISIRSFKLSWNTSSATLLFGLFCAGFMTLQTSSSYILSPILFLYIGFCLATYRKSIISSSIIG